MSNLNEGRGVTAEEFQRIRNDRTLQRRINTETKRQHHLQRIRDSRSRSGVHPLDQFPKEIWEKILEPLSPKDLGNTLEVHDLFHDVLENKQIRDILFPQILNLKFTPFWKDPDYDPDASDEVEDGKPVPLAEFIKLREVSKSLRNAIDDWHENEIMRNLHCEMEAKITSLTFTFPGSSADKSKLNGILENFSVGKARRFFMRSIIVKIEDYVYEDDEDEDEEREEILNLTEAFSRFKCKITNLLKIIGPQIWRFEYDIQDMDYLNINRGVSVPVSEIYQCLKEWTELMPNLKWFVLNNESEDGDLFTIRAPKSVKNSNKFSFPHLKHLERVCCVLDSQNYTNGFDIFSTVLKTNQHIKALVVIPGMDADRNMLFFKNYYKQLLQSIPFLNLEVFSINPSASDTCMYEYVEPVINSKWPLKRLHLGCDTDKSTMKSLFELLENFQTLEHLSLHLADIRFNEEIPFLRLPNLSHVELDVNYTVDQYMMEFTPATNFFFSLQFLLFADRLKKLTWKLEAWEIAMFKLNRFLVNQECHEKCINFRAGLRDLRSSNFWDCFPCLKIVSVEIQRGYDDKVVSTYHRGDKF